jgi:mannose/fructose/N-acetylgalactosamine-specific phosphotransferase system component IID
MLPNLTKEYKNKCLGIAMDRHVAKYNTCLFIFYIVHGSIIHMLYLDIRGSKSQTSYSTM